MSYYKKMRSKSKIGDSDEQEELKYVIEKRIIMTSCK